MPALQTSVILREGVSRPGPGLEDDVTVVACVGANGSLTLDVQEKVGGSSPETVGVVSLGSANQRLTLRAKACLDRLAAIEVSSLPFPIEIYLKDETLHPTLLRSHRHGFKISAPGLETSCCTESEPSMTSSSNSDGR